MRTRFAILFTTFFIGLGFGLAFPVFSPLVLDPASGFFPCEISQSTRGMFFGFLVACFAIGQFLGNPILGSCSDKYGRKKVLAASLLLAIIGYALASFAIGNCSIFLLLLARFLIGFSAGNYPVAQCAIIDSTESDEKQRVKQFGLLAMAWGIGFIIGPFISGKLLEMYPKEWSLPFVLGAFFAILNYLVIKFFFNETISHKLGRPLSFKTGIQDVKKAFSEKALKGVLVIVFVFSLGINFFNEFASVFLNQHLNFDSKDLATFFTWLGVWLAISQGILIRPVVNRWESRKILPVSLLFLGLSFFVLLFIKTNLNFYFIIPLIAFFQSFIQPCAATLLSRSFSKEHQGEILGINGAVQYMGTAIIPLVAGTLVAHFPQVPVVFTGLCMVGSGIFFILYYSFKNVFNRK